MFDLKHLDSAPFDKNYVRNPMVIYEYTLFRCGPYPDLKPGMWSAGLIKTLRFPTMNPRGNVPRRKQILQSVAGPHFMRAGLRRLEQDAD